MIAALMRKENVIYAAFPFVMPVVISTNVLSAATHIVGNAAMRMELPCATDAQVTTSTVGTMLHKVRFCMRLLSCITRMLHAVPAVKL